MPERPPSHPGIFPPEEQERDLNDERVMYDILETGTDADMDRLEKHLNQAIPDGFSRERLEQWRIFARQRRRLIDQSESDTEERIKRDPKASDLEYQVGVYWERLERPVRDAVFTLRKKGYTSYESGFDALDSQKISFRSDIPELSQHKFSQECPTQIEMSASNASKNVRFRLEALAMEAVQPVRLPIHSAPLFSSTTPLCCE